ncbi:hypothetical protein Tco_0403749 [Tanacetum coccineum]
MVAYLQKPEGSEAFHQIVDFLNASHIKYAHIENPKIYTSLIQQFWGTATARTTNDGEQMRADIHTVSVDIGGMHYCIGLDAGQGSDRVKVLENDMQQTKKVYSSALTKLILRVKKLEKKVKTNKARRRARIVISEDEFSTASATLEVSTATENLVYTRRSAEKRKDKGKAIMKEAESVQKKSKKQLEQEGMA